MSVTNTSQKARWRKGFPPANWLAGYNPRWLREDLVAGITLAAFAIPVSLAYATLAGLPPQMGLYCYLVGGVGYAMFGTSRHLAIGPTSAMSLIFGVTLAPLAGQDLGRLLSLTTLTTLLVAVFFAIAWVLRLSVVVNFISESILVGFKAGAALAIAVTQLPKLFGIKGGGDDFIERLWLLAQQLGQTNLVALATGLGAIVLLVLGDKRLPGRPVALAVVMLSLAAVPVLGLTAHGLKVVGALPAGLPAFAPSQITLRGLDVGTRRELASLAFACFLLSYIESVSAARTFALKHHYDLDAREELLGLGAANLLTAFFQGYPSAGGLSQSAVNENAGARTPLSLVFASGALALVLLFLTGLFRNLPATVLAAIVLVAVKGLIDVKELRHLYRVSRLDFTAAMVALAGVLLLGILDGVILAMVASVLILLVRSSTPHVAFLGRIPGTNGFSDLGRHPDNETIPGVLVFRVESALLYYNVDHILSTVLRRISGAHEDFMLVICDLSNSAYVDIAGTRMLTRLCEQLKFMKIEMRVVGAHASQRDILRAEGLEAQIGLLHREAGVADVLKEFNMAPRSNTGQG